MGVFERIRAVFQQRAGRLLDRVEDPRDMLDYAYQQQQAAITKSRRALVELATARKRVEAQIGQLQTRAGRLQLQAQTALQVGQEALAREALGQCAQLSSQLGDLHGQLLKLTADQESMVTVQRRALAHVERFRQQKDSAKIGYTAAKAQEKATKAAYGLTGTGDGGGALQRAEERTAQMQARAAGLSSLLDSAGGFGPQDTLNARLDRLSQESTVEVELARMRAMLPPHRQELESGSSEAGTG